MPGETHSLTDPCHFQLPVCGRVVAVRHPTGAEDLLLLEATGDDTGLAVALASRLTQPVSGGDLDWRELPLSDLDAFILRLRQTVIGNRVRADVACQAAGCARRIDISFGIDDYLMHHKPARPSLRGSWNIEPADESGWFRMINVRDRGNPLAVAVGESKAQSDRLGRSVDQPGPVSFRLPTVADRLATAGRRDAAEELARRCIRPSEVAAEPRRRVESTMELMAPSLSSDLRGVCPECGAEVVLHFDARQFCLREFRDRAAFIYQDVDLLARRYHWSETEILTMPLVRRTNYAELARQEGGQW